MERRQEKRKGDGRRAALGWEIGRPVREWRRRGRTGTAEHKAQPQRSPVGTELRNRAAGSLGRGFVKLGSYSSSL